MDSNRLEGRKSIKDSFLRVKTGINPISRQNKDKRHRSRLIDLVPLSLLVY